MQKKVASLALIIVLMLPILFINCSTDPDGDGQIAPEIPPITTFLMNFDIIDANDGGRVEAMNNWAYSVLNVGFWNAAITVTFAVPLVSFAEAFNHDPSFDESLPGWIWEYDYSLGGINYTARLEATVTLEDVEWRMFITQENVFTDYLWYSGSSNLDGLEGQWVLNRDPTDPVPFIQIDWNRALEGDVAAIRYLNVVPDSDDNGSYIFFQVDNNSDLNRSYDIFSNPMNHTIEIDWDSENKDGRVKSPNHFQDSEFHCWDETLEDVDCPE